MKKIIAVIPIAILFILLSPTILTHAATLNQLLQNYQNVVYLRSEGFGGYFYQICVSSGNTYFMANNNIYHTDIYGNDIELTGWQSGSLPNFNFYTYSSDPLENPDLNSSADNSTTYLTGNLLVNIQANNPWNFFENNTDNELVFESLEEYENYINPEPEPDPTWFEIWSNRIYEFLDDWFPWATDLDHWLDDIYLDLFGMKLDGDDVQYGNDIEFYNFPSPTPFPTQIPYQEQIIPDGNGGFTIQYIYPDPSGNPITASAPPPEPTYIIKITDTPQYDISGVPVPPADGLQDAIDAIDDNIEDYQEGFEAIQGSFSVLPVKWFFFFGIPAAIILIAGIIRSLLGG